MWGVLEGPWSIMETGFSVDAVSKVRSEVAETEGRSVSIYSFFLSFLFCFEAESQCVA